jgi:hypothetical protein
MININLSTILSGAFSHIEGDTLYTETLSFEILKYLTDASAQGSAINIKEFSDTEAESSAIDLAVSAVGEYLTDYLTGGEIVPIPPAVGDLISVVASSSYLGIAARIGLMLLEWWIKSKIDAGRSPNLEVDFEGVEQKLEEIKEILDTGLLGESGEIAYAFLERLGMIIPNIQIDVRRGGEHNISFEQPYTP